MAKATFSATIVCWCLCTVLVWEISCTLPMHVCSGYGTPLCTNALYTCECGKFPALYQCVQWLRHSLVYKRPVYLRVWEISYTLPMCAVVTALPCVQTPCIPASVGNFLHSTNVCSGYGTSLCTNALYTCECGKFPALYQCVQWLRHSLVYKRPVYLRVWEISCTLPMCAVVTTLPCVQTACIYRCIYMYMYEISSTKSVHVHMP